MTFSVNLKRLPSFERPELDVEKRAKTLNEELWQAAYNQNWDQVRTLLNRDDIDVNFAPPKFQSVLWMAAIHDQRGTRSKVKLP